MRQMLREILKPMFLVLFCSMFLTAASELAPGQWVDLALTRTVHMQGILLLVYVSGLMFVARHFAGPLVHRLSPIGLLWFSCLLASLGLVLLSVANSPVTGLLAASVWGTGVCFMWPTMLATASERFPRGGAVLMGLMGTAGTLSSGTKDSASTSGTWITGALDSTRKSSGRRCKTYSSRKAFPSVATRRCLSSPETTG